MSINHFFRIFWVHRAITFTTLIACILGALLVIKLVPARYQAHSRVLMDIMGPDPVTGEVLSSSFARAFVKTQTELISDYRVAGRVVDALGWTGSSDLAADYAQSGSDVGLRRWLAQLIIDRTEASMIEDSNIMDIGYTTSNPETAAQVADALRQAYADQTAQFKQQSARKNGEWFKSQTAKLRTQLAAAEKKKTDFERENDIVLQDDNTDSESARLAALGQVAPAAPMISAPAAAPVFSPSQAQLAQVDAAIANASRTLGPNHPDLIAMKQQRSVIAAAAAREMATARSGGGVVSSGPSIGAMFSAQQDRVLSQRGLVAEARQLLLNVTVLRDQLTKTAARAAQLEQESQSTETGLTFLGSATPPESPSFPQTIPLLLGSLLLGLGLGVLTSLLVEMLNRRVRGADDIILDGIPVLGILPADSSIAKPRRSWLAFRRRANG